jgi:hypothetical protein
LETKFVLSIAAAAVVGGLGITGDARAQSARTLPIVIFNPLSTKSDIQPTRRELDETCINLGLDRPGRMVSTARRPGNPVRFVEKISCMTVLKFTNQIDIWYSDTNIYDIQPTAGELATKCSDLGYSAQGFATEVRNRGDDPKGIAATIICVLP